MKNILTALIIISTLLLSSCKSQNVNNTHSEIPVIKDVIETIIEESIAASTPHSITTYSEIPTISFPVSEIIEGETSFLAVYHPFNDSPLYTPLVLSIYYYSRLQVTGEFIKLVDGYEYEYGGENWRNRSMGVYEENLDKHNGLEKLYAHQTDLDEFDNLYKFVCDFGLSEQQIRNALTEWNESGVIENIMVNKYIYSEEEINAIATKNKEEITRLFATELAIVKGDKIYVPGWFFYSSLEDYKDANITTEDLIDVLNNCRNYAIAFSTLYLLDLIEYKAYNYLNGDVDVIELCAYDRDFDVPMAYDGYYESIIYGEGGFRRYLSFFNSSHENDTSIYNVIKGEEVYSPHWVYYNKPAAYREAGITPDELLEMLPKYKSLSILSDEAVTALENKIFDYAADGS